MIFSNQIFIFDNCVITDIEVANIVCYMDNLLISYWLMHCGKLSTLWFSSTDYLCGVESFGSSCVLTICVVWKAFDSVVFVNILSVCCGKLSTVVFVNRLSVWCGKLSTNNFEFRVFNVPWKTYWYHRVSCTVENLLISSCIMYRGKLTYIIVYHVPWKTYSHHYVSCTVENLLILSFTM